MTNSITTTIGQEINEVTTVSQAVNPLANIWLGVLLVCLGVTAFSTAVLVAWPFIAHMIAG
ncbi:hypothetical protein [Geopsychrobacter electrodiphilus]|uniref:hypothetical protein n=1 Tax=Geopsychrobacter electrodiphilus TaxID=225196 RepID=UPI00036E1CD7|nr:hypothetical protein [Geopsychrobacter electrodiphilus]